MTPIFGATNPHLFLAASSLLPHFVSHPISRALFHSLSLFIPIYPAGESFIEMTTAFNHQCSSWLAMINSFRLKGNSVRPVAYETTPPVVPWHRRRFNTSSLGEIAQCFETAADVEHSFYIFQLKIVIYMLQRLEFPSGEQAIASSGPDQHPHHNFANSQQRKLSTPNPKRKTLLTASLHFGHWSLSHSFRVAATRCCHFDLLQFGTRYIHLCQHYCVTQIKRFRSICPFINHSVAFCMQVNGVTPMLSATYLMRYKYSTLAIGFGAEDAIVTIVSHFQVLVLLSLSSFVW